MRFGQGEVLNPNPAHVQEAASGIVCQVGAFLSFGRSIAAQGPPNIAASVQELGRTNTKMLHRQQCRCLPPAHTKLPHEHTEA